MFLDFENALEEARQQTDEKQKCKSLKSLAEKVVSVQPYANVKKFTEQIETLLSEISYPDEFLDDMYSTLMVEPVIVPGKNTNGEIIDSGYRIDRKSIAHFKREQRSDGIWLESDFSRVFLPEKEFKTDVELQKRIQEWCD